MARLLYASTTNSDMFYAVKMNVSDNFFYLDLGEKKYIFLDHRELEVFNEKNTNKDIEAVLLDPLLVEAVKSNQETRLQNKLALYLLKKYSVDNDTIEVSTCLPLDMADFLRGQNIKLKVLTEFFPQRMQKTTAEKEYVKNNLQSVKKVYEEIERILSVSTAKEDGILIYEGKILTSEYLKRVCDKILLEEDMINSAGIIISCGAQSCIPHHMGEGPLYANKSIICDIFPRHRGNGYFADMTRTYVKGKPSIELAAQYEAVLEAQELVISLIKPGVKQLDVHKRVQQLFIDKGYHIEGEGFIHGTGHGLGVDIHESPYMNISAGNSIFQVGNIITVEPGLYYKETGGVRIEDVVYVSENGCENLTNYPKIFSI